MTAETDPIAPETTDLPASLAEIVTDFAETDAGDRLQLLLEFSSELPDVPERYADHPELLEAVPECQSPIFLVTEVDNAEVGEEATVHLHFSAPPEAPTTRGFAGILHEGLDGQTAGTVLAIPADLPLRLSMTEIVSPLRLRGMSGMLARIQRQVAERIGKITAN
ncbi:MULTISPECIES: SufE family protein [unclassified Brevibacterium]|uniref:SufE family protein n=1 Tax=unclassified Brevibacterium TaxID=2614124 RepID=UPI001E305368|nr:MULTISPECIES: SufE family protein [unclassified Brevibacterium]MCD1284538.1 cysteine desulfuration protein SufE [Brevibacterium sp. CCUG 69071]MDK8435844.1 SufE family protein [Brevibacterium sp. H-BE7]